MSSPISLFQMPDIAMDTILKILDFKSIRSLRKVCHGLRNSIDRLKPESFIRKVMVLVKRNVIFFDVFFDLEDTSPIHVRYEKHDNGCYVMWNQKNKWIENYDYVKVFCEDFISCFRYQKHIIQDFDLQFVRSTTPESTIYCSENIKKVLEHRSFFLKVKKVFFIVLDKNQVLSVLPYLDSNSLKKITIIDAKHRDGNILEMDEIAKLDQWKQADILQIHDFSVLDPSHFINFSKATLCFETVTMEDVLVFKEALRDNQTFKDFTLGFKNGVTEEQLVEVFGQFFINPEGFTRRRWFFRCPFPERVLSIEPDRCPFIYFESIKLSEVPGDATIMD